MDRVPVRRWKRPWVAVFLLVAGETATPGAGVLHTAWSVGSGLPHGSVMALAEDVRGPLWIGTQRGLARFDGTSLVAEPWTARLPSQVVLALASASDGGVWVGTPEGLARVGGLRPRTWRPEGPAAGREIRCVVELEPGVALGGNRAGELLMAGPSGLRRIAAVPGSSDRRGVEVLRRLAAGGVLVGAGSGLWRLGSGGLERVGGRDLDGIRVFDLTPRTGGGWWAATESGLFAVVPGPDRWRVWRVPLPGRGGRMARAVREWGGELWVGTLGSGLFRGTPRALRRVGTGGWDELEEVRVVEVTSDGSLWAGGYDGGLHRAVATPFLNLEAGRDLPRGRVWAVVPDGGGGLWVGAASGLFRWVGDTVEREPAVEDAVTALLRDGDGTLWIGTSAGRVGHRSAGGLRWWDATDGVPRGAVTAFLRLGSGVLWLGSDGGLARFHDGSWTPVSVVEGLADNRVTSLAELSDGRLLVGTWEGPAVGTGDRFEPAWGGVLAGETVEAMAVGHHGAVWIGLRAGQVCRVDTLSGRVDRFPLPWRVPAGGVAVTTGELWVATVRGLLRAPLEGGGAGRRPHLGWRVLGLEEGMAAADCSGGVASVMAVRGDGSVCVATVDGVSCLDPSAGVQRRRPRAEVREVLLDGRPVAPADGPLRVPVGVRRVEFRFGGVALWARRAPRFVHRLDGIDGRWQGGRGESSAVYAGLPPGAYTFRVRAVGPDGRPDGPQAAVALLVAAPLHRRAVVLVPAVLLFLAAGPAVYMLRVRTLKVRQARLERLVAERTRELAEAARTLERLSLEDPVTGIPNHRRFRLELERSWAEAARTGAPVSLLMVDIDRFKALNDRWGHLAGDRCLAAVAGALAAAIRRPRDLVARYGGEEFAVLLPGTPRPGAARLAERMRLTVQALRGPEGVDGVTVSVGAATAEPARGGVTDDLIRAADAALYLAKRSGRNRVAVVGTSRADSAAEA